MNPTNAQLQEMINDLPENIQKAIHEFDWAGEVMKIGRAHQLQIDDIEIFRLQTLLVMLGHLPSNAYEQNLANKLHVSGDVAASLVDEANHRIFSELQRRAFQRDVAEEPVQSRSWKATENYLEPIEHEDLAGVMRNEGVELVAHEDDVPVNSDLSNEVSSILGNIKTSPGESSRNSPVRAVGFDEEIASPARNDNRGEYPTSRQVANSNNGGSSTYLEPIEASDMKGVKDAHVDTSILKNASYVSPEKVFDDGVVSSGRDLGQKKSLDQSLDQHIMENPFLAKGDSVDASPTEVESIKEENKFLEHLAE